MSKQGGSCVDHVVIVGGGLGGLSAAIQLRKHGIDAQVYEKNPGISGGEGTLIALFPNGSRALGKANPELLNKMRNEGITDFESSVVTPDGQKIGGWTLGPQMEEKYGHPMIAILWKDALRILSEELPDSCKHTGYQCYDVTEDEDGAIAHFNKDNEQVHVKAPLIIGADGIRSVVRNSLFGNITLHDNERSTWRAVINSSLCDHPALVQGAITTTVNGRTMFLVNKVHGKLYWSFTVSDEASNGDTKRRSKDGLEMKERLLSYFKGWELATQIIEATNPDLIMERRMLDLPVLPKWFKGRVVLLGDAVHAVTPALGQGANMAFEDGLDLALQLTTSTDVQTALENYEARRLPRVEKISEATKRTGHSQEFYDWLYTYDQ